MSADPIADLIAHLRAKDEAQGRTEDHDSHHDHHDRYDYDQPYLTFVTKRHHFELRGAERTPAGTIPDARLGETVPAGAPFT